MMEAGCKDAVVIGALICLLLLEVFALCNTSAAGMHLRSDVHVRSVRIEKRCWYKARYIYIYIERERDVPAHAIA